MREQGEQSGSSTRSRARNGPTKKGPTVLSSSGETELGAAHAATRMARNLDLPANLKNRHARLSNVATRLGCANYRFRRNLAVRHEIGEGRDPRTLLPFGAEPTSPWVRRS